MMPGGAGVVLAWDTIDSAMQSAGALGVDGGLARDDGLAHGYGSIVGAALGATLIVKEGFEDH
ncbi:hypothetical protein LP417_18450 [Polaromonas sp. P1-6]|nr:hypothetical protein LP417_18450 [Polaromonas sp. P1-6]